MLQIRPELEPQHHTVCVYHGRPLATTCAMQEVVCAIFIQNFHKEIPNTAFPLSINILVCIHYYKKAVLLDCHIQK